MNPIEHIKKELQKVHPQAKVILKVTGYINSKLIGITEKELANQLKDALNDKVIERHFEVRDISRILEDELFKSFLKKTSRKKTTHKKRKTNL